MPVLEVLYIFDLCLQERVRSKQWCSELSMLPNFIFTEGSFPDGRAGAVGMMILPRLQRSQPEADFREDEPCSKSRLRPVPFLFSPPNKLQQKSWTGLIPSWYHAENYHILHSFQSKLSASHWNWCDRIFGALTTPQPETFYSTVPHCRNTWTPCHSHRPTLPPEEQLQGISKHFNDVSCLSSSACSKSSARSPLCNL